MERQRILDLLAALQQGAIQPEAAAEQLERALHARRQGLDFAHLDVERVHRTGLPEFVFGQGKSAEQITLLMQGLHQAGQVAVATRVDEAKAAAVVAALPGVEHHAVARILLLPPPGGVQPAAVRGTVAVVCAGTSDLPVAEEAAVILEALGHPVLRVRDVGVAGIHRVVGHLDAMREAQAVIVVAGMVGRPVIGVPTSVGYGAAFGGIAALLGMLNSCAPGVSVVNIDNGFGAACQAALINRR